MLADTTTPMLPADLELTPARFEYVSANKIRVVLKTSEGETCSYIISTGSMLRSLTMAVDLLNSRKPEFWRDLHPSG